MRTTTTPRRPAGWGSATVVGLLLALPGWGRTSLSANDSLQQRARWPLATQLRLTQPAHIELTPASA